MRMTNTKMDPCCANQKPIGTFNISKLLSGSAMIIPQKKEIKNQIRRSIPTYVKFLRQYCCLLISDIYFDLLG